ncbi:rhomboid family intramembrane serine protease [Planococcus sp. N028]|uniref:Rhomboid family intramembrane serine protease n=1 Tax=Planococcus shixiaomingii TaxID=3058393 RepID=A0ABT8N673_9BACL|nr:MULTISPECIES: rhomboid family intramembrane serine protease [unclassified Planococcus (in: firmicutes)]MDN7243384.1 rhomboid family intramembrane serine protease [Planococcus sp. N028]WKA55324.1 rhomboid family intramembrane serine protease [Planococcus sp. N022]
MFLRTESFSQYIRLYPVVSTLIAISVLIHILTWLPGIGSQLFLFGFGYNLYIAQGEWWRFITPVFLHGGFMHLLFNMFSLFLFGPELERLTGKVRFITIYLLAGFFGSAATYFLQPLDYSHVGASGAIFGIFGAFGALLYYGRRVLPQLRQIILPIIVISIVMTFLTPNVNATAHIAGLLTGFLIGLGYFHPKRIVSWKAKK